MLTCSKATGTMTKNPLWWLRRDRHSSANRGTVAGAVVVVVVVAVDGDDGGNHKYYAYPVMVPSNGS